MFTWILLAIVVAALFGVINLDSIREWSIEKGREAWPHVKNVMHNFGEKIESAKAKVENTKHKVGSKYDEAKEDIKDNAEEIEDDFNDNNRNY